MACLLQVCLVVVTAVEIEGTCQLTSVAHPSLLAGTLNTTTKDSTAALIPTHCNPKASLDQVIPCLPLVPGLNRDLIPKFPVSHPIFFHTILF